jgi:hypothetical protein
MIAGIVVRFRTMFARIVARYRTIMFARIVVRFEKHCSLTRIVIPASERDLQLI